jgi:hypothetical protein
VKRIVCLLVASVAVLATANEPGGSAPSRIVDRTFVCTPFLLYGGIRDVDVKAIPRGDAYVNGTGSTSTGYIGVGSGQTNSELVFARARLEPRYRNRPLQPGVYADVRRCARTRVTVPLTAKGLPGAPTAFETYAECQIRGRVITRVRAVLEGAAPWQPDAPPYAGVLRNVVSAQIAVRSERTRKPLGFIEFDSSGKTKHWAAAGCA